MADFKYEIVEHIGTLSESAKGGQRNLTRFHGMVENLSMISGIGHLSMRKWEKG